MMGGVTQTAPQIRVLTAGEKSTAGEHNLSFFQGFVKLGPVQKRPFNSNSSLLSEFYPRNINYMPVVEFIELLD